MDVPSTAVLAYVGSQSEAAQVLVRVRAALPFLIMMICAYSVMLFLSDGCLCFVLNRLEVVKSF